MNDEDVFWDDGLPPPPLKKGDKPFINDDERTAFDKQNGYAYFGFKKQAFFSYADQYISAAYKLVQDSNNLIDREKYVLPIVFLYRHSIELRLKGLLHEEYKNYRKSPVSSMTHHLDELWDMVRKVLEPVLQQRGDNRMLTEVEGAEEFIKEFAAVDRESDSFRYPINKKGQPTLKGNSLLQDVNYINLQHIAEKMASLDTFLANADMMLLITPDNMNKLPQSTSP